MRHETFRHQISGTNNYWIFKPASSGDVLELSNVSGEDLRETIEQILSVTFFETDIPNFEGKPVLQQNSDPRDVRFVLGQLPEGLITELYRAMPDKYVTRVKNAQEEPI